MVCDPSATYENCVYILHCNLSCLLSLFILGRLGRKSGSYTMCKSNGNTEIHFLFHPQLRQTSWSSTHGNQILYWEIYSGFRVEPCCYSAVRFHAGNNIYHSSLRFFTMYFSPLMLYRWRWSTLQWWMCFFTCPGPYWAVCCSNTGRKICLGNWCSDKNSIHGHSGTTIILDHDTVSLPIIELPKRFLVCPPQDIARLTFIAMRNENLNGKLLTFAGPRAWTTQEVQEMERQWQELKLEQVRFNHCFQVITLCERLAGQDANVTTVPVSILRVTRQLTRLFEWTNDVADRLAFSEVLLLNFHPIWNPHVSLLHQLTIDLHQTCSYYCQYCYDLGSYKWHCVLCPNDGNISTSGCWCKRHRDTREIPAGLFLKHTEEVERS